MEEKKITLTGNQIIQLINQERQKLEEINTRLNALTNMKNELTGTTQSIQEISKNKKGTKMLVYLGSGVYTETAIENNTDIITTIADNVFKEKKITEMTKILEKRMENIDKALKKSLEEQAKTIQRINQLENILEAGKRAIIEKKAKEQA
ncbi:MAG: prefoldin subunit alpha [Candidatus Diapherotrites archaeon]